MSKRAVASATLIAPILQRWSPRSFSDQAVSEEALVQLFEAARWSASCFNEQPWRFVVASRWEPERHAALLGCLAEKNQLWAKNAHVLVLCFAQEAFSKTGKPNPHAWHDVGAACAQLTLQAVSLGLYVHSMAGINRDVIQETIAPPEGFSAVSAMAIGYRAHASQLEDEGQRAMEVAPRTRKDLSEIFMRGAWVSAPTDQATGAQTATPNDAPR